MSVAERLEGKRICIGAGSGGVGKTTSSAALALGLAAAGQRVAVITIDPAKRLASALGMEELGNEPRLVDPAVFAGEGLEMKGELWAMMLDAKATFDGLIERLAPDAETRDEILANRIYQELSGAVAGSQEFTAVARVYDLHREGGFDVLVLETPPSRNALDFLDAPRRLVQFVDGRSLRMFIRPAGFGARIASRGTSMIFSVLGRLTGVDLLGDLSEFFTATSSLVDGFRERAERVQGLLSAEGTEFLIVCGPAGEPIEEAAFLRGKLGELGLPLGAVIVNRVHGGDGGAPPGPEATKALRNAGVGVGLAKRITASHADLQALVERDAENVEKLVGRIGEAPLLRVPEMSDEVHDLAGLLSLDPYLFGEA